jgi:SPX domain protein involved in polyphosphate accumulation
VQIEKVVLFILEQQGRLASRIQELEPQRDAIIEASEVTKVSKLKESYREVGHDLLKLLRFIDMNATGIRKILKKFDKRFGYKFTDYYVGTRSNHHYSQLQQVFKQVVHFNYCVGCLLFILIFSFSES